MTEPIAGQPRSGDVEGIHYYSERSITEVIELYLRIQDHTDKLAGRVGGKHPALKKGPLGLDEMELNAMRREAVNRFFDGAKLSEELREQRNRFRERFAERVERFLKNPDGEISDLAESQGVLFARECETAVGKASGDFGDLLTQALIARRARKDFSLKLRTEIWAEALRFAIGLARFEAAGGWIDEAWGTDPREGPLPHLYKLESIREQQAEVAKFMAKFWPKFEERIRHGLSGWLFETDRRIALRCLLSSVPPRRANSDDPSKKAVLMLLMATSGLTTEQVCAKLDNRNEMDASRNLPETAPIPEVWRGRGARSWLDARSRFQGSVDTYLSTLRRVVPH